VAFYSAARNLVTPNTNGRLHIFVHDRESGQTVQVSLATDGTEGNGDSRGAGLSYNGRFVAFRSDASNLVAGDTNGVADMFVRDRDTDNDGLFDEPGAVRTDRISMAADGSEATGSSFGGPSLSADGHMIAFAAEAANLVAGDTNESRDIFVHTTGYSTRFALQIQQIRRSAIHLPALRK
jgi:Tol biopolymer transport system component